MDYSLKADRRSLDKLIKACVLVFCFICLSLSGCAKHAVPERLQFLGYPGEVNEHHLCIHAPPARIFSILIDHNRFTNIVPADRIRVLKMTSGPYGVGTVIRTETGYKIKIGWNSKVVGIEDNRRIVLQFQDGIFRGGYEVWDLEPEQSGTCVSHTIVFNISNFIYKTFWVLKQVESKHNALVEATLENLKRVCESQSMVHAEQNPERF